MIFTGWVGQACAMADPAPASAIAATAISRCNLDIKESSWRRSLDLADLAHHVAHAADVGLHVFLEVRRVLEHHRAACVADHFLHPRIVACRASGVPQPL